MSDDLTTATAEEGPHGCAEGIGLADRARDHGEWQALAEWLVRNPQCGPAVALQLDGGGIPNLISLPAPASVSDLVGLNLGRFEVLELLGRGSFADVFRVYDPDLKRELAIKVMRGGDPAKFRIEAERVAGLTHENVVTVLELGESARGPFLVMPLMTGGTLEAHRKGQPNGRLTADEAAKFVRDIARGVHHAHRRGLIHRDLKPLNVLLDENGTAKVADFGLARPIEGTASVGISGTFAYMPLEQAEGKEQLSVAVDVWALGVTLFELLTGRLPFGSGAVAMSRINTESAPFVRTFAPEVSADLEAVCLKCMEKRPEARYATALELAEDLGRYLRREPVFAPPPGFWDWVRQLARTQPERDVRYSWEVTAWFGALTLGTNVAIYALARFDAPAVCVWGANLWCSAAMGLVLWWYMMRRFRQLPATERHSLIIAAGHVLAYLPLLVALVPLSLSASARTGLALYPPMTMLSGLGLFTLGSTNWSRFFPVGIAMMWLAPLMTFWPNESPLLFGCATAAVMWYWTLMKRHMGPIETTRS